MQRSNPGRFFEDFRIGDEITHATPRTVSEGDTALYQGLYGSRFAVQSSCEFARAQGYRTAPVDDVLVFHLVFGKSVPDVSLNAVANLGYAEGRFGVPVFPGDTLSARSTVIGLRENANGKTGVVWVHTVGSNQHGAPVVDFKRWVMVNKRDAGAAAPEAVVPKTEAALPLGDLSGGQLLETGQWDATLAGSDAYWDDYQPGEKIDHVDGMTIEEAEHMLATRLYQNTARVHFDAVAQKSSRFGKRLIYGGHIISLARSLSFNGLANAFRVAAINGGSHVAPTFAGDTIYAWTEVLDKAPLPNQPGFGAVRLRTIAAKDTPCAAFPGKSADGKYDPAVVLDFDYTVLMPTRPTR